MRPTLSSRPSIPSSSCATAVSQHIKRDIFPQQSSLRNLARFYRRKTKNKLALAGTLFSSSSASSSSSLSLDFDDAEKTFGGEGRNFKVQEEAICG
jgi:hypothetical protein